ncbi:hypothetical protein HN51_059403, partial [Arachis hypogaea]
HSERGFSTDAVALAEEIWKASKRESLEASIEAAFEAIISRGTDSHVVPSHSGHNIILMSNHQTEADPAVIALLIEKKAPHLAKNMTYVAGDRVGTNPLCKPFSFGRGGSQLIWIAPSGGKVRKRSRFVLQQQQHQAVDKVERCWWLYLFTRATLVGWLVLMIVGKVANFMAYIYAPAILVMPFGAISIIVSAILAHFLLNERLLMMGVLGCLSCNVGSIVIVIHAPQEQTPTSV